MKELNKILPHLIVLAYIGAMTLSMFIDIQGDTVVFLLGLILLMLYTKD